MTTPGGGAYSAGTIFLQVVPSFRNFQKEVRQAAKNAEKAFAENLDKGKEIDKAVGKALDRAGTKGAKTAGQRLGDLMAKDLGKRLDTTLRNLTPVLRVQADTGIAKREIELLLKQMLLLRDKVVDVDVDVDGVRKAEAEFAKLATRLFALEGAAVDIEANALVAKAVADLKLLESQAERTNRQRIKLDVDKGFINRMAGATGALRGFNAMVLLVAAGLPAIAPAAAVAAGAILGLGAAAGAAGAGLGVLILGFSGLAPAVKAMEKVSKDGAEQQRALDKTTRAAAKGVREAEQRVSDARTNAANAAEDAARRVTEARQDVQRAEKEAGKSIRAALKDVERAEDELADAQRNSAEAQRDLREARLQAKDDLADLESKVKKGALDERQGLIDLFEAQVDYNAAQKEGATNLEREQAAIALERARIALADQRRENKALAAEQKRLNKEGVEGTDRVVNARERAAEAQEKESDASRRVGEAQEAVEDARVRGAERVANAQEALADAQRAQARQAQESARSQANAAEALADAQANYRDQLMATTASADELKDAMAGLTPAGQEFAKFIFGLKDEFAALRATAQQGLLPGVQRGIESILAFGPQINGFVDTYARAMGSLIESTLKGLTTKPWRDFFAMLEEDGPGLLQSYGQGFGNLGTAFAQMFTAFAPLAKQMAEGFERLTGSLVRYFASTDGQEALKGFMEYVQRVGPKVLDFFGSLVTAIVNIGVGLAPYGETVLAIFGTIFKIISAIPPDIIGAIVFAVLALIVVVQTLAGVLGALGFVFSTIQTLILVLGATMTAWIAVFIAVAIGLVMLYSKSETFRNIVNGAFRAVMAVINAFWETIKFVVRGIFAIFKGVLLPVFELAFAAFFKFTPAGIVIKTVWEKIIKPALSALGRAIGALPEVFRSAVEGIKSMWEGLKEALRGPLFFVVETLLNNGLIKGFNKLADFFGTSKIDKIDSAGLKPAPAKKVAPGQFNARVPGFATGGHVGGYSPSATADNIPAWLTAGEFVLPVNAVKKLRALYGDEFLEGLRKGLPGFAQGGLVGFGRLLQTRGFRVNEHPSFGGVRGRHSKNSLHYSGQAIDVNYGPGGENDIEKRAIDQIVGMAASYGLRSIWRTAGHFNHAHFDTGRGGNMVGRLGNLAGKVGGGIKAGADFVGDKVGQAVEWAKDGPISWLKGQVTNLYGPLKQSTMGKWLIGGFENKVLQPALGKVASMAGIAGDYLDDKPKLYDQGGWLPPGMSQIVNATGKPELILTPEQAESVLRGGGSYQINVPMMPTNSTPNDVAEAVLFAARRINRGGVYAGKG